MIGVEQEELGKSLDQMEQTRNMIGEAILKFPAVKDQIVEDSAKKMQVLSEEVRPKFTRVADCCDTAQFAAMEQSLEKKKQEFMTKMKEEEAARLTATAEHMEFLTLVIP